MLLTQGERKWGRHRGRGSGSLKFCPLRGEIVARGKEPYGPCRLSGVDLSRQFSHGGVAQRIASLAGRVAQVEDDICDGVVVELAQVLRQRDLPLADRAGALEGEVAFVVQVGLEQAAVAGS